MGAGYAIGSIYPSIDRSIHTEVSIYLSTYLSKYELFFLSMHLPIYHPTCLSVCLCVCPFMLRHVTKPQPIHLPDIYHLFVTLERSRDCRMQQTSLDMLQGMQGGVPVAAE